MRIKILLGVVVGLLVMSGAWYAATRSRGAREVSESTTVRIANLPVVQGLPVYLALEKGYFKEAGLNVELVSFAAPNQIIDALLQNSVDLTSPSGAMGIVGIADFKHPGKLKVYAAGGGDLTVQNDAILVKTSSTLATLQDLKGKNLGIVAGSIQWRTVAQYILAQNGLETDKDVQLVELALGVQAQALESGQIDALLGIEPIPTIIKANGIGRELVDHLTSRYVATPFYAGAGVISVDFAEHNPKTAEKVLAILKRAIAEINQDPEMARRYLKGYTSLNEVTIAQVPISRFKFYDEFTADDLKAVQAFYDIFTNARVIDGDMDFSKLVYSLKAL